MQSARSISSTKSIVTRTDRRAGSKRLESARCRTRLTRSWLTRVATEGGMATRDTSETGANIWYGEPYPQPGAAMKSRVDPTALAETFVGAVTHAARELADRIEQVLHPDEPWSAARSEVLEPTLTSMKFVLDATGRIASDHLAPADRELFMSTVESLTLKGESEELRQAYSPTRRNGSRFKAVLQPEGKATRGTLLWELAESVCRQHGEMNPAVATILSLVAANTFEALADERNR